MKVRLPSVSIIIPLYGRPSEIRVCLESLEACLEIIEEVIVVDNASPDEACQVAESFGFCRVIRNAENRGFAGACNQGAASARGEYLLFLNSDTIVPRSGLGALIYAAAAYGHRAVAFGPVSNYAGNEQRIDAALPSVSALNDYAASLSSAHSELAFTNLLSGFCFLIKREVFKLIGGFDERFIFGNFEDDDLCRRLTVAGHPMAIVKNSFIHHFGARTIVTLPMDVGELHNRNQAAYRQKWIGKRKSGDRIAIIGGCGYLGSALYCHLEQQGYNVESFDIELRGRPACVQNNCLDYRNLTAQSYGRYDWVIFLAAHSSVQRCADDPWGAIDNNIVGFINLLKGLGDAKLIYASSGSVYNQVKHEDCNEFAGHFHPTNVYDVSKMCADLIAEQSGKSIYGLRLGTVNGPSPNIRAELMINKMVGDAISKRELTISSSNAYRAVLAIDDFCRATERVITTQGPGGIYNVASFSTQIGKIAGEVSSILGAKTRNVEGSNQYDFVMDTAKFEQAFGFDFTGSVASIVQSLIEDPELEQPSPKTLA